MDIKLQFIGPEYYDAEVPRTTIYHPQTGGPMRMLCLKRNDTGPVMNPILRDSFGRTVNLQGSRIKFVMREIDNIGGPGEEQVIVSTQERVTILNQLKSRSVGEFQVCLKQEDTECAGKFYAEFQVELKGIAQNKKPGPYALVDGSTLLVSLNDIEQTVTFNAVDFADITAATVAEVVAVMNTQLTDTTAHELKVLEDSCYVILEPDSNDLSTTLEITGGTADDVLGFGSERHKSQRVTVPQSKLLVVINDDLDEKEEID